MDLDHQNPPRFAAAVYDEGLEPLETFCTQPETRVDFLYFFGHNPLKSPDSDE
jgi:hypothetical protein